VQNSEEAATISTKLVGKHWLPSVLPALAVAREMGLNLDQSRSALTELVSMEQRLSPATTPNGVTFLRDEWNGSVDTLTVALEVLKEATAKRKILVFSDVSDSVEKVRRRQRRIGGIAAQISDAVVFVGDAHEHAVRGAIEGGMSPCHVWGFYGIKEASEHLRAELREGDLVLLRGRTVDHLSRLYLAMLGDVNCWLPACKKKCFCDVCPELKAAKLN
jgi:UDP-N-acetylmuramoyl-tripeptide--D-alanyl-D-alanine ligase